MSPGPVEPKTEIYICCFSPKNAVLRSKKKDWMAQNQDNMSE